jgi:hypothetical protein
MRRGVENESPRGIVGRPRVVVVVVGATLVARVTDGVEDAGGRPPVVVSEGRVAVLLTLASRTVVVPMRAFVVLTTRAFVVVVIDASALVIVVPVGAPRVAACVEAATVDCNVVVGGGWRVAAVLAAGPVRAGVVVVAVVVAVVVTGMFVVMGARGRVVVILTDDSVVVA